MKKNYLVLCALLLSAPMICFACPTCIGRVQENSSTTFFHEENEINQETNSIQNDEGAS